MRKQSYDQGTFVKGKRKVKTIKWRVAELFQTEAQRRLQRRSSKASRFLDIAQTVDEPTGVLAGQSVSAYRRVSTKNGNH